MSELSDWVKSPRQDFKEGVSIYNKHKLTTKHDAFFNTSEPNVIHLNMLYSQLCKALIRERQHPDFKEEVQKVEPIKIKKIESKPKKIEHEKAFPSPQSFRGSKPYINKLLALNWSDLSFDDKLLFFNSEKYFLNKKSLFIENSDIEKEMRSLHAKVKLIDPDAKFDGKRKAIMEKLDLLDQSKAANWEKIDTWTEPQEFKGTEVEKAVQDALVTQKKIKANQIYIYRAEKKLMDMPNLTDKQREKRNIKQAEIDKRKKELIELGQPYKK